MPYSVRQVNLEEGKRGVVAFWRENFPNWPIQKFGWFYQQNVFGPACCWTLVQDKKIVGSAAAFPRDFVFRGRYIRGAVTGDFGVDRGNRLLGPALQLQRAVVCESRYDLLYGFPNQHSEPVQLRAGFKVLGAAARMVRVLRADRYVSRRIKSRMMARLSTPLANQLLRIRHRQPKRDESLYRAEEPAVFDSRFDRLWERVAVDSSRLMGIRDRNFLNRRFVSCPYIEYRIFALSRTEDESLVGYVVYRLEDQTVHIADCLAAGLDKRFDLLLSAFVRQMQKVGFHAISMVFLGDGAVVQKLRRLGFSERADKRNVVVAANPSAELPGEIFDPDYWYFCEADND